jgi:hypothetical protein
MPAATAPDDEKCSPASVKPIYYDGVHAIPIDECVNNAAHETDLKVHIIDWQPLLIDGAHDEV